MTALTLYPAIDLKDGACVRLRRGDMADATIFSDDPGAQARAWQTAGCRWLHVVDLDGAFAGASKNIVAVRDILSATDLPVQLGGGLRDMAAIEQWLAAGVRRVILGSAAVKNPALVRDACRAFPGRIVVGIDARDGMVATEGWAEVSRLRALDLALAFEDAGVAAIIYTDIERDGMLGGLNIDQTMALAGSLTTPVIASGGVGSLDDLVQLKKSAGGTLEGVIVGRALYDGRIDPATRFGSSIPDRGLVLAPNFWLKRTCPQTRRPARFRPTGTRSLPATSPPTPSNCSPPNACRIYG